MKKIIFLILLTLTYWSQGIAQHFQGTYQILADDGVVTISLKQEHNSNYSGKITGNNNTFKLNGAIQDGILRGKIGDQETPISFEAIVKGNFLTFTMIETNLAGIPDPSTAQTLILQRKSLSSEQSAESIDAEKVIINNKALTEQQIQDITKTYGVKPLPGNYWYDAKSGLYGVVGYPSYGFMLPGHDFGPISPDASHGFTGVVINGRILPQSEWLIWSYILDYWIQPNNYWLDHNGNAGLVGIDIPLVNLFTAARQNQYLGKGASGDNFWSSRFSAGNSDSGNQRGYVSVPGHGPVGYGF